jgi:hypothetical protein
MPRDARSTAQLTSKRVKTPVQKNQKTDQLYVMSNPAVEPSVASSNQSSIGPARKKQDANQRARLSLQLWLRSHPYSFTPARLRHLVLSQVLHTCHPQSIHSTLSPLDTPETRILNTATCIPQTSDRPIIRPPCELLLHGLAEDRSLDVRI